MILGAVYRQDSTGNHHALPLFITMNQRIAGFPELNHEELIWVMSWASKPYADDMILIGSVHTVDFLNMFRNMWYPSHDSPVRYTPTLSLCVFNHYKAGATDIWSSIMGQIEEQQEHWKEVNAEIARLTPGKRHDIIKWYTHDQLPLKWVAFHGEISRHAVKELVFQETGSYPIVAS